VTEVEKVPVSVKKEGLLPRIKLLFKILYKERNLKISLFLLAYLNNWHYHCLLLKNTILRKNFTTDYFLILNRKP